MDKNLALQFTAVAVIILAALLWIAVKVIRMRKKKSVSPCCGCSLVDNCNKKELRKPGQGNEEHLNSPCSEPPNHASSTDRN